METYTELRKKLGSCSENQYILERTKFVESLLVDKQLEEAAAHLDILFRVHDRFCECQNTCQSWICFELLQLRLCFHLDLYYVAQKLAKCLSLICIDSDKAWINVVEAEIHKALRQPKEAKDKLSEALKLNPSQALQQHISHVWSFVT